MYLGIDLGTSAVKIVITDDNDTILAESVEAIGISRPHPLWSEQDPLEWWAATQRAMARLETSVKAKVRAIGLSGQMHGAVMLDKARQVIRPAMLWNDGRSFAECDEILRREPRTHQITANLLMPGFTASKPVWVKNHEPENFALIDLVLLPKDYLRLCMTGEAASDMSDAAGTSWLDVQNRCWSDSMLAACDLTLDMMPKLFEGSQITGQLRGDIAQQWGMNRVPVCAGGGDNAAGAVGVGVVNDGDALLSLGTSGVLFAATSSLRPNIEGTVHAFCHSLPNMWHQMSVMLNAASCLDWVCQLTQQNDVGSMLAALEADGRSQSDAIFHPYLSGERTPHNNPHAKGAFFDMGPETDRFGLTLSVLEGVSMAMADGLRVLNEAGTHPSQITVIGGGSKSTYWGRILASALNCPLVYRMGCEVGPSLGAARLARLSLGEADIQSVCVKPPITQIIEPDAERVEILATKRARFNALYQAIKPLYH